MSGSTPGPWKVDREFNVVSADSRRSVATTGGYSNNTDAERVDAENKANARLVAAAPDLYAALRDILAVLVVEAPKTPLNHHKYDDLGARAHAAIAKAEGR